MPRPPKIKLDFFPLDTVLDTKFQLIEAEFGLTGFAVIVKLFQMIYGEQGYYCEWTDEVALLFATKNGVGYNVVSEIIAASVRRGIFDKTLFDKYHILTSNGIQRRYLLAVNRRVEGTIKREYSLIKCTQEEINADINEVNVDTNSVNDGINATKEKKEKEKKIKESKVKEKRENTDFSAAAAAYEQNIGNVSDIIAEKIENWLNDVDLSLMLYAIDEAVENNAKSWKYINAILQSCFNQGIKTREQKEAASYKRKGNKNSFCNYEERKTLSDDELEMIEKRRKYLEKNEITEDKDNEQ